MGVNNVVEFYRFEDGIFPNVFKNILLSNFVNASVNSTFFFSIVGMPYNVVKASKDRIQTALKAAGVSDSLNHINVTKEILLKNSNL